MTKRGNARSDTISARGIAVTVGGKHREVGGGGSQCGRAERPRQVSEGDRAIHVDAVGGDCDGIAGGIGTAGVDFHKQAGLKATLTGVQPPGRFGALQLKDDKVMSFQEKPEGDGSWINGGFFVLEPSIFDEIDGDSCIWERKPLESLATQNQLGIYRHQGFWRPMDTLRDKMELENLWDSGKAPWKNW